MGFTSSFEVRLLNSFILYCHTSISCPLQSLLFSHIINLRSRFNAVRMCLSFSIVQNSVKLYKMSCVVSLVWKHIINQIKYWAIAPLVSIRLWWLTIINLYNSCLKQMWKNTNLTSAWYDRIFGSVISFNFFSYASVTIPNNVMPAYLILFFFVFVIPYMYYWTSRLLLLRPSPPIFIWF